jgi:hypothetical protein
MPIPAKIKDLINQAWVDGYPCLLGTFGKDGPNISVKGSLFVYDDNHLAYWERARMKALDNLGVEKRVAVIYARMRFKVEGHDGVSHNGFLRFYGTAEIHEDGPVKEAIFSRLSKREQEHEGADKGVGVLIRIERSADALGKPIM